MTKFFFNLTSYVQGYQEQGVEKKEFWPDKTNDLDVMIIASGIGLRIIFVEVPETFNRKDIGESFK